MGTMYDSTAPALIPADAEIVGGYVDGRFAWSAADWARFPNAFHVPITVFGAPGARVIDCETGDATPGQAAGWAWGELLHGRRPTIYMNASTWPLVVQALGALAIPVSWVDFWVAQYDDVAEVPIGAAAKQYQSTTDWDISTTNGLWPYSTPPQPAHTPAIQGKGDDNMTSLEDANFLHVWATINGVVNHWWQYLPGKGTNPANNWFRETLPTS